MNAELYYSDIQYGGGIVPSVVRSNRRAVI